MKYRKKPVVVEVFQWFGDIRQKEDPDWIIEAILGDRVSFGIDRGNSKPIMLINTLEGVMTAYPSDYIIKGVQGEIYPCKPDIFEQTYEEVSHE
ncbi:TPA: hypothetical protein U1C91_000570 [Streptococcus suis]|nr:hypothetical protein [Streptococcus suis]HEM3699862.1 hypothetical protein [Streptococcus suis]